MYTLKYKYVPEAESKLPHRISMIGHPENSDLFDIYNWLKGEKIVYTYSGDWYYRAWQLESEEDASAFKLKFGI